LLNRQDILDLDLIPFQLSEGKHALLAQSEVTKGKHNTDTCVDEGDVQTARETQRTVDALVERLGKWHLRRRKVYYCLHGKVWSQDIRD
jgi:hypothetical protein